jgi:hypothetical protein
MPVSSMPHAICTKMFLSPFKMYATLMIGMTITTIAYIPIQLNKKYQKQEI